MRKINKSVVVPKTLQNAPVPKNIEVYEVSEYGRAPTKDEIKLFRGM